MFLIKRKDVSNPEACLPGRTEALQISGVHVVNGNSFVAAYPEGLKTLRVGMGCFWGVERLFWQLEGIWVTAAGYAGGTTPNPTYEEVCSGETGHTEVVQVVFDPAQVDLESLLKIFWENHDPTQGMRQGNDRGTQYRSALYLDNEIDLQVAELSKEEFQSQLSKAGMAKISTEISLNPKYYFAEDYHQQYLYKNPNGYCNLHGTGVLCKG